MADTEGECCVLKLQPLPIFYVLIYDGKEKMSNYYINERNKKDVAYSIYNWKRLNDFTTLAFVQNLMLFHTQKNTFFPRNDCRPFAS